MLAIVVIIDVFSVLLMVADVIIGVCIVGAVVFVVAVVVDVVTVLRKSGLNGFFHLLHMRRGSVQTL